MVQFLLILYEVRNLSRLMWKIDLSLFLNKNTKEKVSKSYKKLESSLFSTAPPLNTPRSPSPSLSITYRTLHHRISPSQPCTYPNSLPLDNPHALRSSLTLNTCTPPPHPLTTTLTPSSVILTLPHPPHPPLSLTLPSFPPTSSPSPSLSRLTLPLPLSPSPSLSFSIFSPSLSPSSSTPRFLRHHHRNLHPQLSFILALFSRFHSHVLTFLSGCWEKSHP